VPVLLNEFRSVGQMVRRQNSGKGTKELTDQQLAQQDMIDKDAMSTSLRRRFLSAGRALWLVAVLFLWVYWLVSVPVFIHRAAAGDLPTTSASNGEIYGLVAAERAASWGVSVAAWSWINIIISGLTFLIPTLLALLIWRRRRDGFGLLTAFVLLVTASESMTVAIYSAEISRVAQIIWEMGAFIWPVFLLWLYLFPDGRAVPRRLALLLGPLLALFAALLAISNLASWMPGINLGEVTALLDPVGPVLVIPLLLMVIGAQVYRYLKVSGLAERRQTKWFVLSLASFLVVSLLFDFFGNVPAEIGSAAFLLVIAGVGVSILRYRLWEIDIIIRKTLIYGLLTAMLAAIYFGSVVLLQAAVGRAADEQSPLVIVLSTLLIAALFSPLRLQAQRFIDQRFYRSKYDAGQSLARFAQTAQDEVELEALTEGLLEVVGEALRPEQAFVWLRKPERKS
jgi:hypothetical protein